MLRSVPRETLRPEALWTLGRVAPALFLALAIATLLLRRPEILTDPRLYPEDRDVLYLGSFVGSPLDQLLRAYNGVLLVIPRMAAWLERLGDPAAISMLSSVVIGALAATYVGARATFLPVRDRWILAAFVILVPAAIDLLGILVTSQFYVYPVLIVGLLSKPLERRSGRIAEIILFALLGLTGPAALLLLPIALWRLPDPRAVVVAAAGVVAGVVLVTAGRLPVPSDMTWTDRVGFLVSHGVVEPVLGVHLTAAALAAGWAIPAIAVALAALLVATIDRRGLPFLYLWLAIVVTAVISPQGSRLEYLQAGFGTRYVVVPAICAAAIVLMGRPRPARVALGAFLSLGVVADFVTPF